MLDQFIGKVLAEKYRIDSGFRETDLGKIYHGTHLLMDKRVAVKILSPALAVDENIVKQFSAEARNISNISHPNILNVTDFGSDTDGTVFIVFDDADGETLKEKIKREEEFDAPRAVNIVKQIAAALSAAHLKHTIHRGLNSENVLVDEMDAVKVLDFGVVKTDETLEDENFSEKIQYLSPEQCADTSDADERSDIYSLGVIFYEMLAGEVPFKAENASDLMLKHAQEPPPPLSSFRQDLPSDIEPIILQMLAKNPDMRYQTAVDLYNALIFEDENQKEALVSSNENFMDRQVLGIVGSLILFVGVFTPILSVPLLGNVNYFANGKGDGVIILILSVLSFFISIFRKYKALALTGILSLATLIFTFINFQIKMSEAQSKLDKDLSNNPFAGLGQALVDSVHLQWGWAVLIIGAGLLIYTGLIKDKGFSGFRLTPKNEAEQNIWKTAFVVLAGISLLSVSLIWATSSKTTDPATLQADANSQPVQPINPATGMNESGLSNIVAFQQTDFSNSNVALVAPETLDGGTFQPWDPSKFGQGIPVQIPQGGNYVTTPGCDPNNPLMPCDVTLIYQNPPTNTNTNTNANVKPTPKTTKSPEASVTPPPQTNQTPVPANSPQVKPSVEKPNEKPKTEKTPPTSTKKNESGTPQDS